MVKVMINADDFGWSESCTLAILKSFDEGLIDTTTMICTGEYFENAVQKIFDSHYACNVGIHFDLTEGCPITDRIKNDPFFCDGEGRFHMHINRYAIMTAEQKKHAYEELSAQAMRFRGTGLRFHHADSHHHIHTALNIYPIMEQVTREFGIEKMRISRNVGKNSLVKRVFKAGFNELLRLKRLNYTDFFGSPSEVQNAKGMKYKTLELMVHPDSNAAGELIDRAGDAPYDAPFGVNLFEEIDIARRMLTESK